MKSFQSRTNSDNSEEEDINMNNSLTSNLSIEKNSQLSQVSAQKTSLMLILTSHRKMNYFYRREKEMTLSVMKIQKKKW